MLTALLIAAATTTLILLVEALSEPCELRCVAYRPYICIDPTLHSSELVGHLERRIRERFSMCHWDTTRGRAVKRGGGPTAADGGWPRPSLAVSLIRCAQTATKAEWVELAISDARHWIFPSGCRLDLSLLLVERLDGTLLALVSTAHSHSAHTHQILNLHHAFNLTHLDELFDEVLHEMNSEEDYLTPPPTEGGDKQHWPTWAIIVLIACVFLSILAFFIGNCINKRAAPLRQLKGANSQAKARRTWGAGFSGGLWAAA